MEIIGVDKTVSKVKWQEIAKRTKNGEKVGIYTLKTINRDDEIGGFYQVVVGFNTDEEPLVNGGYYQFEDVLAKKKRAKWASILGEPTIITPDHYNTISFKLRSKAVTKVSEVYAHEFTPVINQKLYSRLLETEEGMSGILGDVVKKVSRKIARDTFDVSYSSIIQGEMRVTNKTLQKNKPLDGMYSYNACIGLASSDNASRVFVSIMHGDDTEAGVGSDGTYTEHIINMDRVSMSQFKEGKYFGEAYKTLVDIAVRAMILASEEGYREYVEQNGMPYRGDTPKYSWLTLKDGTKLTWDSYNLETILGLLNN